MRQPRPKRKAILRKVKDAVLKRQKNKCAECGHVLHDEDRIEYDHRPAIIMRSVNVDGTDYHPSQTDPDFIDALHKGCHLMRTVGRLPGAERTITSKGSDTWLAAKFRKLEGVNKPRFKRTIPSRSFSKREK